MKTTLIKLLLDGKGRMVSLTTGALVAAITKALAARQMTLGPEIENFLSGLVALFVMWLLDSLVLKLQADGVRQIQDVLPPEVVSDGVPGAVTVAAVQEVVAQAGSNPPAP